MALRRIIILVSLCLFSLIIGEKSGFLYLANKCTSDEVTCKVNKSNIASVNKYKGSDIYCVNGANSICCDNGLIGCPKGLKCPKESQDQNKCFF